MLKKVLFGLLTFITSICRSLHYLDDKGDSGNTEQKSSQNGRPHLGNTGQNTTLPHFEMNFPTNQDNLYSEEVTIQERLDKLLEGDWVSEFVKDKLNQSEAEEFSKLLIELRAQQPKAVFIDFINGVIFFSVNTGCFAEKRPNETDEELQVRVINAASTFGKRQKGEEE